MSEVHRNDRTKSSESAKVTSISPLSSHNNVSFWDSLCLLLKTTRVRKLERVCDDWKKSNKRRRVNKDMRQRFANNLGATSLFHFLYRLRLRSNYEDADSFLLGQQSEVDSNLFAHALRQINSSSLLILELLIARHMGKKEFSGVVDTFIKNVKQVEETGALSHRCKIIAAAF